jgi:hypothetical protein
VFDRVAQIMNKMQAFAPPAQGGAAPGLAERIIEVGTAEVIKRFTAGNAAPEAAPEDSAP